MLKPTGNIASIVNVVVPVGKWIADPIGRQTGKRSLEAEGCKRRIEGERGCC
ncbi:hypothetical protein Pint_26888 [Pistacia integerrima]|uniref:Uncharacterized protein n=1 Tax=Pistacia integerrima TaxID=434235 RepID=A0ACC0YRF8_9ROSI|nr:hypothetical protein Pint_26888 [Pistacia integerrima]